MCSLQTIQDAFCHTRDFHPSCFPGFIAHNKSNINNSTYQQCMCLYLIFSTKLKKKTKRARVHVACFSSTFLSFQSYFADYKQSKYPCYFFFVKHLFLFFSESKLQMVRIRSKHNRISIKMSGILLSNSTIMLYRSLLSIRIAMYDTM